MAEHTDKDCFIVADVGGTNTRVALARDGALLSSSIARFKNSEYPGLESILRAYVGDHAAGETITGAAVAIAGPVRDGRGEMTNLDWSIDRDTLARATGATRVAVLNDLQAQGYALGKIAPDNLQTAVVGNDAPDASARLVVGVGTGFNASPVHDTDRGRYVPPSEAGHANLPVRSDEDLSLLRYVESAHGFPAVEDVLSGRGLERVYAWQCQLLGAPDELKAAEIMDACASGASPAAERAVATFVRILGVVCGNLCLIHLPFGGVYLVGGVARAMAPHLATFGFSDAFRDKGRFAGFMQNFPVYVVKDDYAALTGLVVHLRN